MEEKQLGHIFFGHGQALFKKLTSTSHHSLMSNKCIEFVMFVG